MTHNPDIPGSVIKRLTKYLAYVQCLCTDKVEWISSQDLADALGLTSSTVRQDLSYVDFYGISKRGYNTKGLQEVLKDVLGANMAWKAVVIGAGNLGRALALHEEFAKRGITICGLFDADGKKIGKKVGGLVVQDVNDMPRFVAARKIDIGILSVPPEAAQHVADLLIAAGIKGLLNLALTHVVAPKKVAIVDSRITASLMELTHAIKKISE